MIKINQFIYQVSFAIVNLIDAVVIFLTLGYKDTGLPIKFASWWALKQIKKKKVS